MKSPAVPLATEAQVSAGVVAAFRCFGLEPERQNAGGFHNSRGQYVPMALAGSSDYRGVFPAFFGIAAGKAWACEIKRGGFNPARVRGKERERFLGQVRKLQVLNDAGGFGFWVNDVSLVPSILNRIRAGWKIVIDDDGTQFFDDGRET